MSGDILAVLRNPHLVIAKTWLADGGLKGYDQAKNFTLEETTVEGITGLSALLSGMENDPHACIIRGRFMGKEAAQKALGLKPGKVQRRKDELFEDQPLHTLLVEVDGFEPLSADPVRQPVQAIEEYIAACLPVCFHGVSYHWQLSASAGRPDKVGILKAHVWFWLQQAYSSERLRAWATGEGVSLDPSVLDPIQVHYTARPRFEAGVLDPVRLRSGFVEGLVGDEVALDLGSGGNGAMHLNGNGADGGEGGGGGLSRHAKVRALVDEDPIASRLRTLGLILRQRTSGVLDIRCPFEERHTSDSGESSTTYFPRYTGGYRDGHFVCMHAHCAGVTRGAFLAKIEFDEADADFDEVEAEEGSAAVVGAAMDPAVRLEIAFVRDGTVKNEIKPRLDNVVMALQHLEVCGMRIAYDDFKDEIVISRPGVDEWKAIQDEDLGHFIIKLERIAFKTGFHAMVSRGVRVVAKQNRFDSAQLWLNGLVWDGVPRVTRFMVDRFGCEDRQYIWAVSLYLWTALAGRVLQPACQADMAPILVGDQGLRKSSAIVAMVNNPDFYIKIRLDAYNDADTSRGMRGKLIGEIDELRGQAVRDEDSIKSFITTRYEKWIPKFIEYETTFPRRLVLIGTVNPKSTGFLRDASGHRRWLPVRVRVCDVEGIEADRDQLWAEAACIWRSRGGVDKGVAWQDAERLAKAEYGDYEEEDAWLPDIVRALGEEVDDLTTTIPTRGVRGSIPFTIVDLAMQALGIMAKDVTQAKKNQIGTILGKLGYESKNFRENGMQVRKWVKKT